MKRKAVFLDRDGTINSDSGYINDPDDFQIYPFAAEAIEHLNQSGFLVFIITNQSGIARGYFSFEDLEKIHEKMITTLATKNAFINEIFISPYHKDGLIEPYNISHDDRKPGLGIFHKALNKYNFRINDSFMIGDRYSDIEFGKKAGLKTILVLTGEGEKEFYSNRKNWSHKPDYIAGNLLDVINLIEFLEE